ncbi:hypothetical protein [Aeromicrobium chenweiae]|uniref:Uncharacterized protein n=1 Tax=Aeromicrobium chenweiae TaxID=2079793 RepID=A0A2S0WKZ4_9ACTN|nr:hypothetical protein [Aeromicrobium chenweiae]AWB91967.1 hypothetical protein C3E78_07020 [Aeromicrobium chenweiae]TGN32818.1 hypothetical protein E4L97_08990 [Aeromicrobium chenweiae]
MAERSLRPSPNVAAVLVLALLVGALLVWQRPWNDADEGPTTAAIPSDAPSRLTAALRDLSSASSEDEFVAASGDLPDGRAFGRRTWASLRALGARDVSLRYISGGDVADRADGSARMVAEVSWRSARTSGLGAGTVHRASVAFRVRAQDDGSLSIVGAERRTTALPIWLAGKVAVERTRGSIVLTVDGGQDRLPVETMAARARSAVERTVPDVRGDVVIVSPRTQEQMASVVGQDVSDVRQIAAVTTSLDRGTGSSGSPVIVLNPAVFATMDRRAAQVVLSHEATHQLTGAVGTAAESWVVEGFADYAALRGDTAPLAVSAGQILAQVRAGATPRTLPTPADFDGSGHGLGAVYESAWMVFRLLDEDHGRAAVVRFYESVLDGTPLATALRGSFGLDEKELTARWRDYLTKSASTVS